MLASLSQVSSTRDKMTVGKSKPTFSSLSKFSGERIISQHSQQERWTGLSLALTVWACFPTLPRANPAASVRCQTKERAPLHGNQRMKGLTLPGEAMNRFTRWRHEGSHSIMGIKHGCSRHSGEFAVGETCCTT